MAVSVSRGSTKGREVWVAGNRYFGLYRVTFDDSYASSGGESLDLRAQGFPAPIAAVFVSKRYVAALDDIAVDWDSVNKKLVVTVASTGAEVAGAVDLSALVVDLLVIGE